MRCDKIYLWKGFGVSQSMLNWHTFCPFSGILAHKSARLWRSGLWDWAVSYRRQYDQLCMPARRCGEEGGAVSLKMCKACMHARYCSAACQRNLCKLRAAKLSDEALFQGPSTERGLSHLLPTKPLAPPRSRFRHNESGTRLFV
jgi:hypothetical protein